MLAIRGATAVEYDTAPHVAERVAELYDRLQEANHIERLFTVTFSVTPDIRSANPATILREKYHLDNVPIMCLQEAMFKGSPEKIIRLLLVYEGKGQKFVYLHRAARLRKDLSE